MMSKIGPIARQRVPLRFSVRVSGPKSPQIFYRQASCLLRSGVMNLRIRPGPWCMRFTLLDQYSRTVSAVFSGPACLFSPLTLYEKSSHCIIDHPN
jgi:hypothetical protein